jgi:hypothetical protein
MPEKTRAQPSESVSGPAGPQADSWLEPVREALRGLRFGSVVIIVQDGVVVQVDRTEKRRLRQPGR